MKISLANKTVIVTGASGGIGHCIVESFSEEKTNIVIHYNTNEEKAQKLFNNVKEKCNAMLYKADLCDETQVKDFYKEVLSRYKSVDVIINNAGICDDALLPMMTNYQWTHVLNTNLTSIYLMCKVFSKIMINQKYGKIINIASHKGQYGSEGQCNYSASKAGIIGFTKSIAKELGVWNIAVNAVCPGFIETNLNNKNPLKKEIALKKSALQIDAGLSDLLVLLKVLASDSVLGISGQVFNIDSRIL